MGLLGGALKAGGAVVKRPLQRYRSGPLKMSRNPNESCKKEIVNRIHDILRNTDQVNNMTQKDFIVQKQQE